MITDLLLIPAVAIANRLAGWEHWPGGKVSAYAIVPGVFMGFDIDRAPEALLLYCGLLLWRWYNTGVGFAAIHGRHEVYDHDPLRIDEAVAELLGCHDGKLYGVVWGCLRSLFLSAPLFVLLAAVHGAPYIALLWFLTAVWGPIYYLAGRMVREDKAPALAETLMGAAMGAILAGIMI